ncbi:MAG: hypothetical protein Q9174_000744 [Haloplaca sp. 1 TL-2023]
MHRYAIVEHLALITCSIPSAPPPTFLCPRFLHKSACATRHHHGQRRRQKGTRWLATAAEKPLPQEDLVVKTNTQERDVRRSRAAIFQSATSSSQMAWENLLEPYLPTDLRRKRSPDLQSTTDIGRVHSPTQDVHILLAEARQSKGGNSDLLAHLVIKEDRQNAVVWLVVKMLEAHAMELRTNSNVSRSQADARRRPFLPLEDATRGAETTEQLISGRRPLFDEQSKLDRLTACITRSASHESLGEIWRSVGSMILRAADSQSSPDKSRSIMACVHRILSHMHHVGAVPESIYNYAPATDPSVLQRPPTLYYWSRRIMVVLSDAYWVSTNPPPKADQGKEFAVYDPDDPNSARIPSVDMAPLVPEVEPHIWLDFVLWCCVEGGWITEAADIVYKMWRRGLGGKRYSVIDWNTLSAQKAPEMPWIAGFKASINRSRMREYAGGATFASEDGRMGSLKPPKRTVSSEVIAAIIDGLVNTASSRPEAYGNSCAKVEERVNACRTILERKQHGLGSSSWNSIVLRMSESLSTIQGTPSTSLEAIVSWSPSFLQESAVVNSAYLSTSPAQTYVADPSAIPLGLLHRLLSNLILAGNYRGALGIFQKLQHMVDNNRTISIKSFPEMVSLNQGQFDDEALTKSGEQQDAPGLNAQLPVNVIAPFLDMITDAKHFDLGRWLLHSQDIDGCIISPTMYSDPMLQPALIRFASAIEDRTLLDRVTQQLKTPLSEATLRALLQHHIKTHKWDGVNEILELLRDGDGLAWDATDVVAIVRVLLHSKGDPSDKTRTSAEGPDPFDLLDGLLRGRYNTSPKASQLREFSQTRMLNQLVSLIMSVPGGLGSDLKAFSTTQYHRLAANCSIPTKAFNMLLESVVELFGVYEGKILCERWCSLNHFSSPNSQPSHGSISQIVKPNLQTFYHVLRPISHSVLQQIEAGGHYGHRQSVDGLAVDDDELAAPRSDTDTDSISSSLQRSRWSWDRSVADWGIASCLELGVTWDTVKEDLPGLANFDSVGQSDSEGMHEELERMKQQSTI